MKIIFRRLKGNSEITERSSRIVSIILAGMLLNLPGSFAQKFWIPTDDFPGGDKTGITLVNNTNIITGTHKGIIRSSNDGRNFENVLRSSAIYTVFTGKKGKVFAGGTGKVFYSDDTGNSWDSLALNSQFPVIRFLEDHDGGLFLITGSADTITGGDGVFYSADNGSAWNKRNNGLGPYLWCNGITIDKNGRLYLAVEDKNLSGAGGLFISENSGNSWDHIDITIDGKNAVNDQLQAGITYGLSVSPEDSVYLSFSGSAINVGVSLNIVKNIDDIRKTTHWIPYQIEINNSWWDGKLLNDIHFAGNGDRYSSVQGSVSYGGTYFLKNNGKAWERIGYGTGSKMYGAAGTQSFAEKENGRIFMIQMFDDRIYFTDTSLITGLEPVPDLPGNIRIFPNPVKRGGMISVSLYDQEDEFSLSVYDNLGKKINLYPVCREYITIEAPEKPGLYFIIADNRSEKIAARLIVY